MPVNRYDPSLTRQVQQIVGLPQPIYYILPMTRGLWPMSSIDETQDAYDISGQSRKMNAVGTPTFGVDNYLPYAEYDGASQYHTRADEAGLDITGNLTLGGWFYFNNAAGSDETMFGKWSITGNIRSYGLHRKTDGKIEARVSSNGTAETVQESTDAVGASTWAFCALRYVASSELSIFVGLPTVPGSVLSEDINTTSIPASINSGASQLSVAVREVGGTPAAYADMRAAMLFLCATDLSDDHLNMFYAQTRRLAYL